MAIYNNLSYMKLSDNDIRVNISDQERITIPEYIDNIPVTVLAASQNVIINHLSISDNIVSINKTSVDTKIIIKNLYYYGGTEYFYQPNSPIKDLISEYEVVSINPETGEENKEIRKTQVYTLFNSAGTENPEPNTTASCGYVIDALQTIWGKQHPKYDNPSVYELAQVMQADLKDTLSATGLQKSENALVWRDTTTKETNRIVIGFFPDGQSFSSSENHVVERYFSLTDFIIEMRVPTNNITNYKTDHMKLTLNEYTNSDYLFYFSQKDWDDATKEPANYIVIHGKLIGNHLLLQSGGFSPKYDDNYTWLNYSREETIYQKPIQRFVLELRDNKIPKGTFIRIWGRQGMYSSPNN